MNRWIVLMLTLGGACFWLLGREMRSSATGSSTVVFEDVISAAGINFERLNSPSQKYLASTKGAGCAFLDYDGDGYLDIFLVNGGWLPGADHQGPFDHALYHNEQDGTFRDVTAKAGIKPNTYYGQGVTVGDYNNDGYDDLFMTNFNSPNILYKNNGDGTLTDVTSSAGVGGDGQWSVSAAFLDYDNDGYLDLYVARYINNTIENNLICGSVFGKGVRVYCSPRVYDGIPDLLYHNNRDGTFTDVSETTGVLKSPGVSRGLGVLAGDYNLDGWIDIFVSNDTGHNFLFENNRNSTFTEVGMVKGVAADDSGNTMAGMGIAMGDFDNDGLPDFAVTTFDIEFHKLYRNSREGYFDEVGALVGTRAPSAPCVGFGVGFVDFDNDADVDLFVACGHVFDNAPLVREGAVYRQPKLLYENIGGRFIEVASQHGQALLEPQVSRGTAFGDYDNDGDVDVLVANSGGRPMLLRNDGGNQKNWLTIKLVGKKSNRNGIGARVRLEDGVFRREAQVTGGGSYASASDYRVHFGLGDREKIARVEVHWPSGVIDTFEQVRARCQMIILEGQTTEK